MSYKEEMKQTHVYLTVQQWKQVAAIAKRRHRSVTGQIAHWVQQALERKD